MQRNCVCGKKEKPAVVTVLRYYRRWDDKHNQYSSSGGMTAICELNYDTMTLTFCHSFCSDKDNFSKQTGATVAAANKVRNIGYACPLNRKHSIFDNIIYNIDNNTLQPTSTAAKAKMKHLYNWIDE